MNDSERKKKLHTIFRFHKIEKPEEQTSDNVNGELSQAKLQELLLFNFEKLATATNNFHSSNKLGQGGFGPVYKVCIIEKSSYCSKLLVA